MSTMLRLGRTTTGHAAWHMYDVLENLIDLIKDQQCDTGMTLALSKRQYSLFYPYEIRLSWAKQNIFSCYAEVNMEHYYLVKNYLEA